MVPFCLSRYSSAQVQDGGRKETSVGFISLRLLQKPLGPGQISTFTIAPSNVIQYHHHGAGDIVSDSVCGNHGAIQGGLQ